MKAPSPKSTTEQIAPYDGTSLTRPKRPTPHRKMRDHYPTPKKNSHPKSSDPVITPQPTEENIRAGLLAGHFHTWYQPKVRLHDGAWTSTEALSRWLPPEQGEVPPCLFMDVIKNSSLLFEFTWQQVQRVLEDLRNWQNRGSAVQCAINLPPALLTETDLPQRLAEIMRFYHTSPDQLTLELTEDAMAEPAAQSFECLARLHMQGFKLSIDDFGTGCSNLQRLNSIAFDELKIDQFFTRNMVQKESGHVIVQATVDLAKRLKLHTVAEGVETTSQWHTLKTMGCDTAQGFLVGRAIPAADLDQWHKDWQQRYRKEFHQCP